MALVRITPPSARPVSLEATKRHLRVTTTSEDSLIETYIDAAVDRLEGPGGWLGRALAPQTWDLYLDAFPDDDAAIEIPLPPLISVDGVFYQDSAGDEQEMAAADYVVVAGTTAPSRLSLVASASWPTPADVTNAVRVRFQAGFVDGDSPAQIAVPGNIQVGILLYVGEIYRNREPGGDVPDMVKRWLRPSRAHLGLA